MKIIFKNRNRFIMKKYLVIASIILMCMPVVLIAQVPADDAKTKTKKIEVTGSAEMEVVPDEIYVNFTLQEYYNKLKNKIDIDQIQKDFLERCTKAGISKERIEIQNMSGFDQNNWYWRKRKKEQPDLMASTTYVVKFTTAAEVDKLVNQLDDNATMHMFISKSDHSKMEDFRKEVKIKALQAAKDKARYLCESIGEKAGQALYIQEIENNFGMPMPEMAFANKAMFDEGGSANEGINFKKITIRYEIKAQFQIQ